MTCICYATALPGTLGLDSYSCYIIPMVHCIKLEAFRKEWVKAQRKRYRLSWWSHNKSVSHDWKFNSYFRKEQQRKELKEVVHKDHRTGYGKCTIKLLLPQWQHSLLQHHQDSHLRLPLLSRLPQPTISIFVHLPQPAAVLNTTTKWGHFNRRHNKSLLSLSGWYCLLKKKFQILFDIGQNLAYDLGKNHWHTMQAQGWQKTTSPCVNM